MSKLGPKDLAKLLEALPSIYQETDPAALAFAFVGTAAQLIPCDITTFDEINPETQKFRSINNYPSKDAESHFPAFMAHVHEHPRLAHHAETGVPSALMISDFITAQQFQKTGLYNEFYRLFGIRYQLSCFLDGCEPLQIGMGLQNLQRDFRERDRIMLDLLRPHYTQAWKNARQFAAAQDQLLGLNVATARLRIGLAALESRRRIEWLTSYAEECLATWFPEGRMSSNRLPAKLDYWLNQQAQSARHDPTVAHRVPLEMTSPAGRLQIRWLPREDGGYWIVFSRDRIRPEAGDLQSLGLTAREAEVLQWIMEGRTNPEIAIILGCRANTVRKHTEHILSKFGVETRGAAVSRALELLASR